MGNTLALDSALAPPTGEFVQQAFPFHQFFWTPIQQKVQLYVPIDSFRSQVDPLVEA